MPSWSPRAILTPLAIEEFVGETVTVAELALQISKSLAAPNQQGFLMPSWSRNPERIVTPHEIEQMVTGTGGNLDAVRRNAEL